MLYKQHSVGIEIIFEDELDVETVRSSYEEHVERMLSLGNDGSVNEHEREVIARWEGAGQSYRGGHHRSLIEKLVRFHEATGERVDGLLDERDNPDRIADAARRLELGLRAFELADSIELHAAMDTEWADADLR